MINLIGENFNGWIPKWLREWIANPLFGSSILPPASKKYLKYF